MVRMYDYDIKLHTDSLNDISINVRIIYIYIHIIKRTVFKSE